MIDEAYLVVITWPDGTDTLLFPRPGQVPIAATQMKGEDDFFTACRHASEYLDDLHPELAKEQLEKIIGSKIQLIRFKRLEVLHTYQPLRPEWHGR